MLVVFTQNEAIGVPGTLIKQYSKSVEEHSRALSAFYPAGHLVWEDLSCASLFMKGGTGENINMRAQIYDHFCHR